MYILKAQDGTLLTFDKNVNILNKLVSKVSAYKDAIIEQLPENKTIYNRAVVTIEEAKILEEQDEKDRINHLTMTALDFIGVIKSAGLTSQQIEDYLNANLDIKHQLQFCQNVYCGVVRQLVPLEVGEVTITDEMIVAAFKAKHNLKSSNV